MSDYIPLTECKKGFVYQINSRNLSFGAYDGKNGFVGIREKFGQHYLFTEYHWDQGPPFGTVHPIKELGPLPEGIQPENDLGTVDSVSQRHIHWVEERHHWVYDDDGTDFIPMRDKRSYATSVPNTPLFQYLEKLENENTLPRNG